VTLVVTWLSLVLRVATLLLFPALAVWARRTGGAARQVFFHLQVGPFAGGELELPAVQFLGVGREADLCVGERLVVAD